jgi:hypothetical protein
MSLIVVAFLVPPFALISLFDDIPPGYPASYRVRSEGSMKAEKIICDQSWLEAESITAFGKSPGL